MTDFDASISLTEDSFIGFSICKSLAYLLLSSPYFLSNSLKKGLNFEEILLACTLW